MLSILKNRKNFKDLKKTSKFSKSGRILGGGGGICWLARIYVYPTSDSIPKHL